MPKEVERILFVGFLMIVMQRKELNSEFNLLDEVS